MRERNKKRKMNFDNLKKDGKMSGKRNCFHSAKVDFYFLFF